MLPLLPGRIRGGNQQWGRDLLALGAEACKCHSPGAPLAGFSATPELPGSRIQRQPADTRRWKQFTLSPKLRPITSTGGAGLGHLSPPSELPHKFVVTLGLKWMKIKSSMIRNKCYLWCHGCTELKVCCVYLMPEWTGGDRIRDGI